MKKLILFIFLTAFLACKNATKPKADLDFTTRFETSNGTETPTYSEIISYYKKLAKAYPKISVFAVGDTDAGKPLHVVTYSNTKINNLSDITTATKHKILINNGIHPGESDGIDASMLLLRDLVTKDSLQKQYKNTIIAVIPVYNIGGALNRNASTRVNQNGPKEYGFRGNARNYDLNRDFIKQDTKNAATFAHIFHTVNPDVFVDNHVSNGADYQYAITHLFTQHNKLGGKLGAFLDKNMQPAIEASLAKKNIIITPYVNVWGSTPEQGFSQFFDSPRYSTGYTTLFNTLGLMVETHMLKPYKIRVEQTYALLESTLDFLEKNGTKIRALRTNASKAILAKKTYPIAYTVDKTKHTTLNFKGYEAELIDSKVTNGKRLFYNTAKPFTKPTPYYNNFKVTRTVEIPKAYILKQGWFNVLERLKNNNIAFSYFNKDTVINVQNLRIKDFKTRQNAYEGHYLHYNTSITTTNTNTTFKKGDIYIPTNQNGVRYLLETLEPEATDSFFNWNFFDTVLQKKEGYSAYVFEDLAETVLKTNPTLQAAFKTQMQNADFAKNPRAQLDFIYKNSKYYEPAHLQLPIYKILK